MKYSLKELIDSIEYRNLEIYKKNTLAFISEAKKGLNWSEWNQDVFYAYFEQKNNQLANLGNGQMTRKEKIRIKEHWMEIAPTLKIIAESQDKALWDLYKKVREFIRSYTDTNKNIATNRMLACLQPNILCTEVSLERLNEILDCISMYTDTYVPHYDYNNWEEASYTFLSIIHSVIPKKNPLDYANIPWDLYRLFYQLKDEGKIPTYWLFPWNPKEFYLDEYLNKFEEVDWKQGKYKINVGDYVYIYCSKPEQKIRYHFQVTKINIPFEESTNDQFYWGEKHSSGEVYCRLKLLEAINTDKLYLDILYKNGLTARPQGKQKINARLLSYIQSCFTNNIENIDPTELPKDEKIFEGAKKIITVNQYERNPIARQKCIEANGCKCKVCGIDFEEKYGVIGRGFIHVHHIVPISTIRESYQVDPIRDLVPVCPNCHAMLHRGHNSITLTIDELKTILHKINENS